MFWVVYIVILLQHLRYFECCMQHQGGMATVSLKRMGMTMTGRNYLPHKSGDRPILDELNSSQLRAPTLKFYPYLYPAMT